MTFSDLSIPQQGRLISAVTDHTLQSVTFGLTYDERNKPLPVRPTTWAGHLRSAPEPGSQDMIRHVYPDHPESVKKRPHTTVGVCIGTR